MCNTAQEGPHETLEEREKRVALLLYTPTPAKLPADWSTQLTRNHLHDGIWIFLIMVTLGLFKLHRLTPNQTHLVKVTVPHIATERNT